VRKGSMMIFNLVAYLIETVQQRWVYCSSYDREVFSYFYMFFILSWLTNQSSAWTWMSKFKLQNCWTRTFHGVLLALDTSLAMHVAYPNYVSFLTK